MWAALNPDQREGNAGDCRIVGRRRLEDTARASAVFALAAALPLPLRRWIEARPILRSAVTTAMVTFWLLGLALTAFCLTGARSAPRI